MRCSGLQIPGLHVTVYPCGPLKSLGWQWAVAGAGLDTPLLWHVLLQLQRLPTTSWLPAEEVLKRPFFGSLSYQETCLVHGGDICCVLCAV